MRDYLVDELVQRFDLRVELLIAGRSLLGRLGRLVKRRARDPTLLGGVAVFEEPGCGAPVGKGVVALAGSPGGSIAARVIRCARRRGCRAPQTEWLSTAESANASGT
ncbi:MAG: hypothetical protein M3Z84_10630 [Actinomycetota bacterium]|nr:hypothetical protein [Actinomycetota bacterium]